jgi:hypothetical protein
MFTKQSEDKIISWIKNDQLDEFGKYLLSGTIHGKPGVPVAELGRIEKIVKKDLADKEQYQLAKKLLKRPEYTARNIGTHLIVSGWPDNKDIETHIKKAANDDDWIVREYAAGTFASLLEKNFAHFSKLYLRWVKTESINVKRAIALAVKYESKSAEAKKWKTYFDLIDPLMAEEAEYIRKNLGPFAIGDGLLSRYPEQIFSSCKKWIKSENENVRWNAAMIFTAAGARKFAKEGKPILQSLEKDASPFVSRAAKKALKNLDRHN